MAKVNEPTFTVFGPPVQTQQLICRILRKHLHTVLIGGIAASQEGACPSWKSKHF